MLGAARGRLGSLTAQELREQVPELEGRSKLAVARHGADVSMAPRVLTQLGRRGADIVRGRNTGHWRLSRPRWTLMATLARRRTGSAPTADEGYAELVRRWLATFGPGTETDIVWWLGSTKTAVRRALADVEAVEVSLDGGGTGWVLPDDLEPTAPDGRAVGGAAAGARPDGDGLEGARLLPRRPRARSCSTPTATPARRPGGTAGSSAAGCRTRRASSRCGCWRSCRGPRTAALAVEAERLTAWLDGTRVGTVYPSVAMKAVDWVHP